MYMVELAATYQWISIMNISIECSRMDITIALVHIVLASG